MISRTCSFCRVWKFASTIRIFSKLTRRSSSDTCVSASILMRADRRLVAGLGALRNGAVGDEMLLVVPARHLRLIDEDRPAARQVVDSRPATVDDRRSGWLRQSAGGGGGLGRRFRRRGSLRRRRRLGAGLGRRQTDRSDGRTKQAERRDGGDRPVPCPRGMIRVLSSAFTSGPEGGCASAGSVPTWPCVFRASSAAARAARRRRRRRGCASRSSRGRRGCAPSRRPTSLSLRLAEDAECGRYPIVRWWPVATIIARSTTLRSSRMLPGHG